jgi:hypothetical protein
MYNLIPGGILLNHNINSLSHAHAPTYFSCKATNTFNFEEPMVSNWGITLYFK